MAGLLGLVARVTNGYAGTYSPMQGASVGDITH